MLLISFILLICMKLMVFMMMINILTIMTMMMILMMIQIIILEMILMMMFIHILEYSLYKIPKASSKRVPDLGTSTGHKPIIDQSCGAVLFFPCRAHRDLSASKLPVLIGWI